MNTSLYAQRQHLAAMDGGDAENAGAIFRLLAMAVENTTESMPKRLVF